jgi:HK97 family phage prohead protease
MQIVGTAIVFDSESQDLGGFTEICRYDAVQKSLQRSNDVFILWQHDTSQPLGRVKTGSLELTLNRAGLDFVATLPASPLGQNAFQAIADGTVDSVSFGFTVESDNWIQRPDGSLVRELLDINLLEISPVTWASYLAPHVDSRSCPASLRSKLKRQPDDDIDDPEDEDEDSEEERCECDCDACIDGRCEDCDDPDCEDEDCLDKDCPMQDEERTRKAHFELLLRRLR